MPLLEGAANPFGKVKTMNNRTASLALVFLFACTPAQETETPSGAGGTTTGTGGNKAGGSGGGQTSSGGSTGQSGGSGGGASASGGGGGTTSSGGAGGASSGGGSGTSSGGGTGNSSGGAAGSEGDASGPMDSSPSGGEGPGAALNNFVFQIACPAGGTPGSCKVPDAMRNITSMPITFGGDPAKTYVLKFHVCGAVEPRYYRDCKMMDQGGGLFCVDGVPLANKDPGGTQYTDTYPTYEMKVSAPAHSYFLNSKKAVDVALKIDYSAQIEVQGGATITFATVSQMTEVYPSTRAKITCPTVPGLTQPYNGQFVHVTVESVTAK